MEQNQQQDCDKLRSFSIELSADALQWLCQKTMTDVGTETANSHFFFSLLSRIKTCPHKDKSFRRPQLLQPGQVQLSEIKESEKLHIGRKRLHNMLELMDSLGLISLCSSRVATVISFPCIKGWTMDGGEFIANPTATITSDETLTSTELLANKEST